MADRAAHPRWLAPGVVAGLIAIVLTTVMRLNPYDESIILVGAVELLHGALPHRDFYFNYGPAQIGIVAGLFALFGPNLTVAWVYDLCLRGLLLLACGITLDRLRVSPRVAVGALAVESCLLLAGAIHLYPVLPVALLALTGSLLLAGPHDGSRAGAGRLVAAGACTGAAALFRYDAGFYVLVAHVAALAWIAFAAGDRPGDWARRVLWYGAGVGLVFLPVVALAAGAGVLPGFVHDILIFPAKHYTAMRKLPWPRPDFSWSAIAELSVYLPWPTAAAGVAWLAERRRTDPRAAPDARERLLAALVLLVLVLFLKALVRVTMLHALMALIPTVLVLAALVETPGSRTLRAVVPVLAGGLAITVGAATLSWLQVVKRDYRELLVSRLIGLPLADDGLGCGRLPGMGLGTLDADTMRAACYVAAHSAPDERIFVGAGRHDKLLIDNISLYFAAQRRPATRWYHFDPGLQTRADTQLAMIGELQRARLRQVVLDRRYDGIMEPNASARSSGVFLLDRYLGDNYREAARFGDVAVYTRR